MHALNLTSRDLDDLLQMLFDRLKGKKDGLALAEPAVILLDEARAQGHGAFRIHLPQFEPIILDAFISGITDTFGYDAQRALVSLCAEIPALSSEYVPDPVAKGLERIHADLRAVETVLDGGEPPDGTDANTTSPGFFHETASGSTVLPLVSNYFTSGGIFSTSRLISPRVELQIIGEWNPRRRQEPAVTFSHIFAEPDDPFERQIHEAIGLAEGIYTKKFGAGMLRRLPRGYHVSLPEIAAIAEAGAGKMSGGSAGLAFTALIVELIGRLELGRGLNIAAGTAFTGSVGASGEVMSVEDSFIGRKVRAVFYSTCRRFVVPEENLPTAETALAELKLEHPRRELELIPARKIGEVLGDSRITRRRRPVPGRPFLQRIFHWRKHLVAGVSALVAAIVSIFILPAYLDRQVASIDLPGSNIVLSNRYGKMLSKTPLGFKAKNENPYRRCFIADVDGKPGNEAICVVDEEPSFIGATANHLRLFLFSSSGSMVKEAFFSDLAFVSPVIDTTLIKSGHRIMNAAVSDTDGDGKSELYVQTHHGTAPPYTLARFSLEDFSSREFIHNGHIRGMKVMDIEEDGRKEIVLSGYNPILNSAVIIVLDPEIINGSSPRGARLELPAFSHDVAKYYIRLPDSYLYEPFSMETMKLNAEFIDNNAFLSVYVKSRGKDVIFDFDENLICRNVTLTELRRAKVINIKEFWADKRVDPRRYHDYIDQSDYAGHIDSLVAGVRYWDGENWQDHPAENRSYEKLRAEADASRTERASR